MFHIFPVVITVNFDQNTYKVNEADRYAQLVLIFDNPSSTDVNVTVFSDDRSATGKHLIIMTRVLKDLNLKGK